MYNKLVKICWNEGCILHTIICIHFEWSLYTQLLRCTLFVEQNWFLQNVHKLYQTFRQTFVQILFTKLSCHSFFNFVYKMYTKVRLNVGYTLHISCINFVYINCIHIVQFLYTISIHEFCDGFDKERWEKGANPGSNFCQDHTRYLEKIVSDLL